ncbi:MAG: SH3 domain-containing protein [Chloroflexi bacterium]|nr:SH3 domain-containing protein [Chloroflexota bacterium]
MSKHLRYLLLLLVFCSTALAVAQDFPTETPIDPAATPAPSPTLVLLPTATPVGNWVRAGVVGAYVRAGPGLRFPVVGTVLNGDILEPVGRDREAGWILVRLDSGFGWIRRTLVMWVEPLDTLPRLEIGALTPSPTATSTATRHRHRRRRTRPRQRRFQVPRPAPRLR